MPTPDSSQSPLDAVATSISSPTDLPVIPSLPPLEMPIPASALSSADDAHVTHTLLSSESQNPVLTPTLLPQVDTEPEPVSPFAASSLYPPSNLRKSISVDSFIRHRPVNLTNGMGRQTRTNTVDAGSEDSRDFAQGPAIAWQPSSVDTDLPRVFYHERDSRFPLSGRSRGASISTATDDSSQSLPTDSDNDVQRSPRGSSKGKERLRPLIPPGELPLPSKFSALSSPSSMSTLSATSSITQEEMSRLPLISPSTTPRWNAHLVGPTVSSARSRSDSLVDGSGGGYASPQETALAYDFLSDVTIAVVGDSGCGKSVAISKGLKSYSLSEPVPEASEGGIFTYISREGTLVYEHLPDRLLRVLEVDNSSLRIDGTVSGLPVWPENAPRLDGVIVCYDVSQEASFAHVEDLLKGFRDLKLPTVVFACKCDLERHVESLEAYTRLNEYDVGLIEVTIHQEGGKSNLRRGFDFLLESIFRERRGRRLDNYQNPASPDVLVSPPPWEVSRSATATPIASSSGVYTLKSAPSRFSQPAAGSTAAPRVPGTPTSPTRARSTSDLLASEHEKSKGREFERDRALSIMSISAGGSISSGSLHASAPNDGLSSVDEAVEDRAEGKEKDNRPAPWATLEELLDKLLFLAVSGDDRAYISHFLLTHRRFVTPRSVILAMQKRMRQLDQTSSDTMFACFAQMRICHLLEIWIQDYPHDFAVGNAGTALNALVKSIISKTHLLHYGSDFLPFLEGRPMVDKDADWALKVEESQDESDDSYNMFDDEDDGAARVHSPVSVVKAPLPNDKPQSGFPSARERKPSLPLMAKALVMANAPPPGYPNNAEPKEPKLKQTIKELQRISQELYSLDPDNVAQEITRISTKLFLRIEPRHWLQHTLVSGPKEVETNSIAMFSQVSNHLADWVVSLILCHDKTKARARQVEKLAEIAQKLRGYNNYSALRAFVAGINMATYQGDPTMELFQLKAPGLSKSLQSWDLLLQSVRSHRAYRMALRNTKGPCIPALEVHLSDLIKAHEGNPDFNRHDPTKIHWAKFSMMGKFILSTTQFQAQCRTSSDYNFPVREHISDLLMRDCVMDAEMQKSRITPPPDLDEIDDSTRLYLPRTPSRDNGVPTKDTALIRKLMFWGS